MRHFTSRNAPCVTHRAYATAKTEMCLLKPPINLTALALAIGSSSEHIPPRHPPQITTGSLICSENESAVVSGLDPLEVRWGGRGEVEVKTAYTSHDTHPQFLFRNLEKGHAGSLRWPTNQVRLIRFVQSGSSISADNLAPKKKVLLLSHGCDCVKAGELFSRKRCTPPPDWLLSGTGDF